MSEFKDYRKKNVQSMRPYVKGEDMTRVSVSAVDITLSTLEGGMIAVNPNDSLDKWYVSKGFFEDHYEEVV